MYAQSVFPNATIEATGDTFIEIGNRSLGEILFHDSTSQRKEWELTQIQSTDSLYTQLQSYFKTPQPFLWRRNSLFYYQEHPLLLEEVYLPPLLEPLRRSAR
jgi:chorismate lyase